MGCILKLSDRPTVREIVCVPVVTCVARMADPYKLDGSYKLRRGVSLVQQYSTSRRIATIFHRLSDIRLRGGDKQAS